jgi:hypothetical protein
MVFKRHRMDEASSPPLGLDSRRVIQPFAPLPGVNRSSTHNADKISLRVNFVAFRVPANLDDPAPRRLFSPAIEAPLWRPAFLTQLMRESRKQRTGRRRMQSRANCSPPPGFPDKQGENRELSIAWVVLEPALAE